MQTAEKIVTFEERELGQPLARKIWRTQSEPFGGAST